MHKLITDGRTCLMRVELRSYEVIFPLALNHIFIDYISVDMYQKAQRESILRMTRVRTKQT